MLLRNHGRRTRYLLLLLHLQFLLPQWLLGRTQVRVRPLLERKIRIKRGHRKDYFTQRSRSRSFATAGAATGAAVPTASPATDDFNGWGGPPSAAAGLAGVFMSRLKPWKTRKGTSESSNSAAPDATEEKVSSFLSRLAGKRCSKCRTLWCRRKLQNRKYRRRSWSN